MTAPAHNMAMEVVTLAERLMSPAADTANRLPREQATDALFAMLAIAQSAPSHERDSERAELVRAIRAGKVTPS